MQTDASSRKEHTFYLYLDFLKVLRFSFPVPVVGPSTLSLAFAAENIKNLMLSLRTREKIWARLVGKSNLYSYLPRWIPF